MIRRWTLVSLLLLSLLHIRTSQASDAKSFFAYIKENAEPAPVSLVGSGREGRLSSVSSTAGDLTFTVSLNGISNYTFNVANIPTNFPIACGGDDRNYCNYPDLPLIETYDLNYYSRRPIPSGRCPDGYIKMPTYDCLNIAPALFETTCCMFMGSSSGGGGGGATIDICSPTTTIDAIWTLCNGSVYISSGAYAWRYNQNLNLQQGPIMIAALTGGCVSRDLAEAEVDGNCNVQFFNMNDQYFITDYATGTLGCTGPKLVTDLCLTGTPGLVYNVGRGTTIYKIDGDGFQTVIGNGFQFIVNGNVTCQVGVKPPGALLDPLQNCSAGSYFPSLDLICFVCPLSGNNQFICTTRNGTVAKNQTLTSAMSNCGPLGPNPGATSPSQAPIIYIPYPIYPVFTGNSGASGTGTIIGSGSGTGFGTGTITGGVG